MSTGDARTDNEPTNHAEARELAQYSRAASNLARCYLAHDAEVATLRLAAKAIDGYRRSSEKYDAMEDELAELRKLRDDLIAWDAEWNRGSPQALTAICKRARQMRSGK